MDIQLVEIFSSVQGEGVTVGRSTLFVRFGGCDLRCAWCDSPQTWQPTRQCRLEMRAGSGEFESTDNPVSLEAIDRAFERLELRRHRYLSLTGGEPLLQPDPVGVLAERARAQGVAVHLETHGLALEALEKVVDRVDLVSMDWKLASDVRRADAPRDAPPVAFHDLHERFLLAARGRAEVFVKLVLTPATRDEEVDEVCRRLAARAPETPLVLQPVTPFGRVRSAPSPARVLAWMRRCESQLPDVRLIPQTHKIVGVA